MNVLYLDDFHIGQQFGSGRLRVGTNQIKSFAAEFDPQPFQVLRAYRAEMSGYSDPPKSYQCVGDFLVELRGFEPLTSAVRLQRSPI